MDLNSMENTEIEKVKNDTQIKKDIDSSSFFSADTEFTFIFKKTEKLASAVYMVTNLFSDNEPMKWSLRKKVSELLSYIITYKDIRQSDTPNFNNNTKTRVSEVVSFLEVAMLSGLVSQMNFSILKQEFYNLIEQFNNNNLKTESTNGAIPKSFFSMNQPLSFSTRISDNSIKDTISLKDNVGFKSTNRQNIILGLLKKKKELTIKDIAVIIKDVSEKTIQRELISLIEAGVLRKTGERRWSKYSLNNS
jgi:hypothetical protein